MQISPSDNYLSKDFVFLSHTPHFRKRIITIIKCCVTTFVSLIVIFKYSIDDKNNQKKTYYTGDMKEILVIAPSIFMTNVFILNLPIRGSEIILYDGAELVFGLIAAINFISGTSYIMIATNSSPIVCGFQDRCYPLSRFVAWGCNIPMMIILILFFSPCYHSEEPDHSKSIRSFGKIVNFVNFVNFVNCKNYQNWTLICIGYTMSILFGAIPSASVFSFRTSIFFIVVSSAFFIVSMVLLLNSLSISSNLLTNSHTMKNSIQEYRSQVRECVVLGYIAMFSLVMVVVIHFGGYLNLYSINTENVCQTCVDLVLKGIYTIIVKQKYSDILSPQVYLSRLLEVERRANEHRRMFLKYVMHEVRVPLNSVHISIEYLIEQIETERHTEKNEDVVDTCENIRNGISIMSETLDNMLSLSAIEENKFSLRYSEFNPVAEFEKTVKMFDHTAHNKGITLKIETDIHPDTFLIGDVNRLKGVVSNYISNAIKFSNSGSTIHVRLFVIKYDLSKKVLLRVEVEDEGVGIKEMYRKNIFTPFSQITPELLQEGRGSGLGLSISKKIIELHGGTVDFDSVYGKGSTFFLEIPLEIGENDLINLRTPKSKLRRDESSQSLSSPARKPRVLIVDDSSTNNLLLSRYLSKNGCDCESVVNGEIAVTRYDELTTNKEKLYDVICMDGNMPVMDGYVASRTLRSKGFTGAIIGCTGNALAEDIQKFMEHGATQVHTKPLKLSMLKNDIFEWVFSH